MRFFKYIFRLLNDFLEQLKKDHVSAYASQAALFMMMALVPILILVLNIIRYTPVTKNFLIESTLGVVPSAFDSLAASIISDLYESSSGTLLSFSIIFTIWSASKGILALIQGFSNINHAEENRNYFFLRLIASFYTVVFVIGIVLVLTLMVFGNTLLFFIQRHIPLLYDAAAWLITTRTLYVPIILIMIFLFMYRLSPNSNQSLFSYLPGAIFTTLGWFLFSYLYSYYIDHFAYRSYSYGSLTIMVLLILWLYICMYIIFIGAEINNFYTRRRNRQG